jgi:hypothetical protein
MRLVITKCQHCNKITDAKHADSIEDLASISEFILAKKGLGLKSEILYYGPSAPSLAWCNCGTEVKKPEQKRLNQAR